MLQLTIGVLFYDVLVAELCTVGLAVVRNIVDLLRSSLFQVLALLYSSVLGITPVII